MPDSFPCTGCGGCCRIIGDILSSSNKPENPVLRHVIESFPYSAGANGACEKLVDNRCSVYAERPLLCKVDLLGELLNINKRDWYTTNAQSCNKIIDLLGLSPSYKITDYDLVN